MNNIDDEKESRQECMTMEKNETTGSKKPWQPKDWARKAIGRIKNFESNNLFQSAKHMSKRSMIIVSAGILCLGAFLAWSSWPNPSGTLSVRTNQPASVVIDGESHGEAPIENLKLAVGKHRIKVRHERTGDERKYVRRIKEDKPSRVQVSWNTKTKKNRSRKHRNQRRNQRRRK